MEQYRKLIKRRAVGGFSLAAGIMLLFILAKVLGLLPAASGENADHLLGYQYGALAGLEVSIIARTLWSLLLLRNGAKLEKQRISEGDERNREIGLQSGKATVSLSLIILVIALLISASYSFVVTTVLTVVTIVYIVIYLGSIIYYSKKL